LGEHSGEQQCSGWGLNEETTKRLNAQSVGVRDGGRLQWGAAVLSRLVGREDLDEEQLWAEGLTCGSKALNQGVSMRKRMEKIEKF
jgi:hypothetical protein